MIEGIVLPLSPRRLLAMLLEGRGFASLWSRVSFVLSRGRESVPAIFKARDVVLGIELDVDEGLHDLREGVQVNNRPTASSRATRLPLRDPPDERNSP